MSSRPEVFRRAEEKASAEANIYRFPSKPHPHTMLLVFEEFSYKLGYSSDKGDPQEYLNVSLATAGTTGRTSGIDVRSRRSVELPFPKQLSDSSSLILNGFSRDPLGEKAMNQLAKVFEGPEGLGGLGGSFQGMGADLAKSLQGAMNGGVGGAIDSFKSTLANYGVSDAAGATRYLLQKAAPILGEFGQSLNLAAGQVLNPRETLAFEGVNLRSHSFNWELFPSNAEDSEQIKKIVNIMKRSVLPSTVDFSLGGFVNFQRAFLKYPHVLKIYLIGVDGDSFPTYKPAMVRNFTVDYGAGGGVSMIKGGKPAGVSISLEVEELSIETADDYGEDPVPTTVVAADKAAFEAEVTRVALAQEQLEAEQREAAANGGN